MWRKEWRIKEACRRDGLNHDEEEKEGYFEEAHKLYVGDVAAELLLNNPLVI